MKTIIVLIAILAIVAAADEAKVPMLCKGYYNAQACFNTPTDSVLNYCSATLTSYDTCPSCYEGFKLDTTSKYCSFDYEKYKQLYYLSTTTNDEVNKLQHWKNAADFVKTYPTTTLDYKSKISCFADGTIIPETCKAGYWYDVKESFLCKECYDKTACLECTASEQAACTKCFPGYYQATDKSCKKCSEDGSVLTCGTDGKATTCNAGYYLASGACTGCTTGHLCSDAETITGCQVGYYKKFTVTTSTDADGNTVETKSDKYVCTTCDQYNIRQCNDTPTENSNKGILECKEKDANGYVYYLTARGCQKIEWDDNFCKTITLVDDSDVTSGYKCSDCFSGYKVQKNGKCLKECGKGYYNDAQNSKCVACTAPCTDCEQKTSGSGDSIVYTYACKSGMWNNALCAQSVKYVFSGTGTTHTAETNRICVNKETTSSTLKDHAKIYQENEDGNIKVVECDLTTSAWQHGYDDDAFGTPNTALDKCVAHASVVSVHADLANCLDFKKSTGAQRCTKCQDGYAKKTYTSDAKKNEITCASIVTGKGTFVTAAKNCKKYKTNDWGLVDCEECLATYSLVVPYKDTTFTNVDTTKPTECVLTSTLSATPAANCLKVMKDNASTAQYKCHKDTLCATPTTQTLKHTFATDAFSGTYTATCATPESSGTGKGCRHIQVNSSGTKKCIDKSADATNPIPICLTSGDSIVYTATRTGNTFNSITLDRCITTPTTGNAGYDCDIIYDISGTLTCSYASTCKTPGTNNLEAKYGAVGDTTLDTSLTAAFECTAPVAGAPKCTHVNVAGDESGPVCASCETNRTTDTATTALPMKRTYSGSTFTGAALGTKIASGEGLDCTLLKDVDGTVTCDPAGKCFTASTEIIAVYSANFISLTGYKCLLTGTATTAETNCGDCVQKAFDGTNYGCVLDKGCKTPATYALKAEYTNSALTTLKAATCVAKVVSTAASAENECVKFKYYDGTTDIYSCYGECYNSYSAKEIYTGYAFSTKKEEEWRCVLNSSVAADVTTLCSIYELDDKTGGTNVSTCSECKTVSKPSTTGGVTTNASTNYFNDADKKCYEMPIDHCVKASTTDRQKCASCYYDDTDKSGYIVNTAGDKCLSCVGYTAYCAEHSKVDDLCKCTKCTAGAYLVDGKCTKASIDNCLMIDPTTTKNKTCYFCELNYKWKDSACTKCTAEDPCVQSGCDGKGVYPGASAAAGDTTTTSTNSTIIGFMLSCLLALATILI